MDIFRRLAPFIQDFIYRERWEQLRDIQVAACDIVFNTDGNLLLATGTASGKTEAAFLPVLTKLYESPSSSVGILYISPLKALINDQFFRLNYLLREADIPVCKWHGDASRASKNKLLESPRGVLQITPESLESLLINKHNICYNLFKDLRFIIIDEVHYFMESPRGIQLLCQLERIQKLIRSNTVPRRIGLSATLGDYTLAENWLNSGTGKNCVTPAVNSGKKKIAIHMECFAGNSNSKADTPDLGDMEHFRYLYKNTLAKKSIIFANSRAEVESTIVYMKKFAEENHSQNVYRIHHGNISGALREETEKEMKNSDDPIVTGATVTLELGIDIGTLDRIVQIKSPFTVSSFAQRLGRCGRRGQPAELLFTFTQNRIDSNDLFPEINWEFLRAIAIVQLYLDEKWIEPITPPKFPYALLYHQTLAFLAVAGESSAPFLAQNILTLTPFKNIPQQDYRILLRHLIDINQLQLTERGGIIIGRSGENVINNYEFYSVFETPDEYTVKCENEIIGTINEHVTAGKQFTLAGRAFECISVNEKSKLIFVRQVKGAPKFTLAGAGTPEIHTKVMEKIREILLSDEIYTYLSPKCSEKLRHIRTFADQSGFLTNTVTLIRGRQYAIFPWLGTRQSSVLCFALKNKGFRVHKDSSDIGYYLIAESRSGAETLKNAITDIFQNPPDKCCFELPENAQIGFKFNNFIPNELLRKQFIEDYVDWR